MDGIDPAGIFPQAGIGRGFRNIEEGLLVELQERGQPGKEHCYARRQAVLGVKAPMPDGIGDLFENPGGG